MSVVVEEYGIDLSGFESDISRAVKGWDKLGQEARKASQNDPFVKQAREADAYNKKLQETAANFGKLANQPRLLKNELEKLQATYVKMLTSADKFNNQDFGKIEARIKSLKGRISEIDGALSGTAKGGGIGGKLGGLVNGLIGGIGLASLAGLAKSIFDVTAEYERLRTSLNVKLGKEGGAEAFRQIKEFADNSPLELAEVTQAYSRLVGIGIKPTSVELRKLTDFALASNKNLGDYVEAIADAQVGENERLKEFGITAQKEGDKIRFTYNGIDVTVRNSREAIQQFLIGLGELPGVVGQTEAAAQTLSGQFSTMTDNVKSLAAEVGTILTPVFEGLIGAVNRLAGASAAAFKGLNLIAKDQGLGGAFKALLGGPKAIAVAIGQAAVNQEKQAKATKETTKATDEQAKKLKELQDRANKTNDKLLSNKQSGADKEATINKQILQKEEDLSRERIRLADELAKTQENYDKSRLGQLDKNSNQYIELKRQLDLKELEQERKKLIELGQMATGTASFNRKSGKVEVNRNLAYNLPLQTQQLFNQRRLDIQSQAAIAAFEIEQRNRQEQDEKASAFRRLTFSNQLAGIETQEKIALKRNELDLVKQLGESEINFERRKQQAILDIQLDFAQKRLQALQLSGKGKNDVEVLEVLTQIKALQGESNKLKSEAKNQPANDIFGLLGISFTAPDGTDLTEAAKQAISTTYQGIQQILSASIEAEGKKIAALDDAISKKREQVETEKQLSKEGLANNLQLKQQELSELERQRQESFQKQQSLQKAQINLDAVAQISNLAVASANIFKSLSPLGPIGVGLAVASIASMVAAFAVAQVKIRQSLPKFHTGGEITDTDSKGERMILAKKGEYVIRPETAQANLRFLQGMNDLKRPLQFADLKDLLPNMPSINSMIIAELPELAKKQATAYQQYGSNAELRELKEIFSQVAQYTSRIPDEQVIPLGDNKVLRKKGNTEKVTTWPNSRQSLR